MSSADQRRPLWAGSLADQPRSDYDDVIVRVLEEPEEAPPPPRDRRPAGRGSLVAGVLLTIGIAALVIALDRPQSLTVADVPSYWGDVPMTCHTARLEQDDGAIEWFWCRAVGGRSLPPGLYRSPESQWISDITRRRARESRIRISADGEVAGWARY